MQYSELFESRKYKEGLAFVAVSLAVFISLQILQATSPSDSSEYFGIFIINFVATILYFIRMWLSRLWANMNIFLVLFFISCWSLNSFFKIFQKPVLWLDILMVVSCINLLALPFFEYLPNRLKSLMCFILGSSFILFSYFSVYLFEIYTIGILGIIMLGLGLHAFVPIFLVIHTIKKMNVVDKGEVKYGTSILAGTLTPLFCLGIYLFSWGSVHHNIQNKIQHNLLSGNSLLPNWIFVAQDLPKNIVTEQYLKSDLVYTTSSDEGSLGSFSLNTDEARKHDPLVVTANALMPSNILEIQDKVHILDAMYLSKHRAQERLWTGENLATSDVISNVKIWPEQRIAYTEKTITVKNRGNARSFWDQEEGIYTFQLPEGGVVTSLSLWIEGKECKGILTSKHKADTAYKTIVGGYRRDPSVVHWQDGNTVSIRVYPVLPNKNRIFKIGITSPLTYQNNKLKYQNISFEGPDYHAANEIRQIQWVTEPIQLNMGKSYKLNSSGKYLKEGNYEYDWNIEFNAPPLQNDSFVFNGNCYTLEHYNKKRAPTTCNKVYLDLNKAWTKAEVKTILLLLKNKNVYIFNDQMKKITLEDVDKEVCSNLLQREFSLFPFHLISEPSSALVISKSKPYSPSLRDLQGSELGDSLATKMSLLPKCHLFNLGSELTPYLRTLKEYRAFEYESGDIQLLNSLLKDNVFSKSIEDAQHIVIENAQLLLAKRPDISSQKGNDHVMRLFTYNHIMSQLKGNIFSKTIENDSIVQEAEIANIVTPVSSLVVLETNEDYKRFDISNNNKSLENASMHSKGAVPEPHEWALIIMVVSVLVYVRYKKNLTNLSGSDSQS